MYLLSNLFSKLQTAQRLQKTDVKVPWSTATLRFIKLLKRQHLIRQYYVQDDKNIAIECYPNTLTQIRQISKSKKRIYIPAKRIGTLGQKGHIIVLSTSYGLLTAQEARILNVGGEILCEIY
uniref:Ribosomal protein S8 n=1 Tax=Chloropicon maureeniae TaxID=1461542 RepID=A0A4D6C722_9CHLO|nr:ribosomal protein S8 [Chloropicon maureeniae]QBX98829.1 ribosomal protein S8 [Chloropicon maureeniae]